MVFSGIVSATGGTLFLNTFNEVCMPAQQPTTKEARNVSAMSINLEELRKEDITNDVEEAMESNVEKARKKEAAMKEQP